MMIAVAFLIITCFYSALHLPTYAEQNDGNVTVGVKAGDWVKYDFMHVNGLSRWENDWTKVEVENVSGTSVAIHVSTEYPGPASSGHMEYAELTFNVDVNGNLIEPQDTYSPCALPREMPYVIAGNLGLDSNSFNDLIEKLSSYTSSSATNQSVDYGVVTKQYGEVAREAVQINQSFDLANFGAENEGLRVFTEFCWDRSTGLLLEYTQTWTWPITSSHVALGVFMRIVDTNLWNMPQPSPPWVEITLGTTLPIAAITLIVVVQKNRNNKKQKGLEES